MLHTCIEIIFSLSIHPCIVILCPHDLYMLISYSYAIIPAYSSLIWNEIMAHDISKAIEMIMELEFLCGYYLGIRFCRAVNIILILLWHWFFFAVIMILILLTHEVFIVRLLWYRYCYGTRFLLCNTCIWILSSKVMLLPMVNWGLQDTCRNIHSYYRHAYSYILHTDQTC